MTLLSSLLLSLMLTIVLTPVFSRLAMRLNIYDVPDARKVHKWPVPRIGGLAIAIGAFASIVLWAPLGDMLQAYLLGASVLVVVGVLDDWKGLDFKAKFIGQLVASLIAVFYGGIGISNLGALFGFLRFNTFPATLFVGDTGSLLLGFSAVFFSIALTQGDTALSPLLPLIILGFPILDTLTVMTERIAHGRSPFAALVLAVFHRADATDWKIQRFDFILSCYRYR